MKKKLSRPGTWLMYGVLLLLSLIWIAPLFTLIATAVKTKKDFFSGLGLFQFPSTIAWSNFQAAFTTGHLLRYMRNDLIICCMKVPLGILLEAMAAFALTRLRVRHRTGLFIFFLVGMMLPMQVALVPISVVFNKLNLFNTYFGLFYVYVGFGLSFGILVFRGFFQSIPKEMDEAAYIDGCNKFQLFTRVILPLAKPATATLLISDFLATWNEFLLANVIITNDGLKTVPTGILTFVGQHGTDYGGLCAGVLISIVPVMIVYFVFQKYFVAGMAGAIKQ
ncbi:MAG TPA: carbohydrate ABC transporter permease [Candidatus Limiplasma sp.]|nr:carbohydrate ABC transporter permease [Candidatus Limiplasma sp.]HPR77217.1 carbohydrate ABC transporter permease [Candidatus Limiplasma sp.]